MRLSLFREKLLFEVEAAQALESADGRLQPHLYCIAALLRKILSRIGDSTKVKVTILPFDDGFGEQQETLGFLSSRILHSGEFRIGSGSCTIVSDHDVNRIRTRMVHMDDFLGAARAVASDHEIVLKALLRQTRTKVNRLVRGGRVDAKELERERDAERGLKAEALEAEALESLSDVFELAKALGKGDDTHGHMTVWLDPSGEETVRRLQRAEQIVRRPRDVSYSALVDNLFCTWVPFPLRQWRARSCLGTTLDFHGENDESWCIAVRDLLAFLKAAEQQWSKGGSA